MKQKNSPLRTWLTVFFILTSTFCIVFLVNKLTSSYGGLDLTEKNLYTLNEGTKNIINKIDEPITLKLYYGKSVIDKRSEEDFEKFKLHYFYVRDLLKNYERISGGKIIFEEYDPKPYTDAEDKANEENITQLSLPPKNDAFYFGLSLTTESGVRQAIGFLDPEDQSTLEYEISQLIDRANNKDKTKLGVMSSLPMVAPEMNEYMAFMMQQQGRQVPQSWKVIQELQQHYEVENIPVDTPTIEEDINLLLIVHPKSLSEDALYAIDQFVMRGGNAVVYVDPYAYVDQAPPQQQQQNPQAAMMHDSSSNLNKLLESWGLKLREGLNFAGDKTLTEMNSEDPFIAFQRFEGEEGCFNELEPLSSQLTKVEALFPGILEKVNTPDINVVPLITTTNKGAAWTGNKFQLGQINNQHGAQQAIKSMNDSFREGTEKMWIAAKASGKFKSAFPERIANTQSPSITNPTALNTHLSQSTQGSTVVVVADVDMIHDYFAYHNFRGLNIIKPKNGNSPFLLNSLEYISGSTDLISIRSRGNFKRPFKKLIEIEKKAEEKLKDEIEKYREAEREAQEQYDKLLQEEEKNEQSLVDEKSQAKKDLLKKRNQARRDLRNIMAQKSAKVDAKKTFIKSTAIYGMPLVILFVGVAFFFARQAKKRANTQRSSN